MQSLDIMIKIMLFEAVISVSNRKMPKINPVSIVLSVKPGKYAPIGNSIQPITSPTRPTNAAGTGPKSHPVMARGMNVKVIRRFGERGNFTAYNTTKSAAKIPQAHSMRTLLKDFAELKIFLNIKNTSISFSY